nr:regulator of telomere elongation helicase 1 [Halisarca dujardinii]
MPCTRDDRHEQLSPVLDLRSSKNTASSTFQEEGDKKRFCCKVSSTASASSSSQSVVPSVGLESHARLMAAAGRTDGHLSTASLDSVSLLNGGKPLLGIQPVSTGKGDRPPSLKSRVWGKTCLVCGSIAVAPHQASCGHCACYQCWMAVMKVLVTCACACAILFLWLVAVLQRVASLYPN